MFYLTDYLVLLLDLLSICNLTVQQDRVLWYLGKCVEHRTCQNTGQDLFVPKLVFNRYTRENKYISIILLGTHTKCRLNNTPINSLNNDNNNDRLVDTERSV